MNAKQYWIDNSSMFLGNAIISYLIESRLKINFCWKVIVRFFVILSLLIAVLALPKFVFALELNPEITMKTGAYDKDQTKKFSINGTIYANLLNKEKVISDLHYRFGDNENRINVAQIKFIMPGIDLLVGRQLMGWGCGYNFNPTDIFNSKPLGANYDPTYSKNGRDAIVLSLYPSTWFLLDLIYAAPYDIDNYYSSDITINESGSEDIGIRVKLNVFDIGLAASLVKIEKKYIAGIEQEEDIISALSVKGSLPILEWGIWLELANYHKQEVLEYVTGLEYIKGDWDIKLEYYRNGFGKSKKENYDLSFLLQGKMLAKDYLMPSISYTYSEKTIITLFSFYNINDGGVLGGAAVEYLVNDYVQATLLPVFINGNSGSEMGIEKAENGYWGAQAMLKLSF